MDSAESYWGAIPANCLEVSAYGLLYPGEYRLRDPKLADDVMTRVTIPARCHDGWTIILARGQNGQQVRLENSKWY